MSGTQLKQTPLLYIYQPKITKPVLTVQNTYLIKKNDETEEQIEIPEIMLEGGEVTELKIEEEQFGGITNEQANEDIDLNTDHFTNEQLIKKITIGDTGEEKSKDQPAIVEAETNNKINIEENVITSEEINHVNKEKSQKYSFQKVKPFKELSIDEKIQYMINFPKQLTPVAYVYTTNTTTYSGFFLNHLGEQIEIRKLDGNSASIRTAEIKNIKMLIL